MDKLPVSKGEYHLKEIDFSDIELSQPFKKNSITSSDLPLHLRLTFPNQVNIRRRNSTLNKNFNIFEKVNLNEPFGKIEESLEILNIFKENLSKMMKNYEKIFSSNFDYHVNCIKKHFVFIF